MNAGLMNPGDGVRSRAGSAGRAGVHAILSRCFAFLLMLFLTAALHLGQAGMAFAQSTLEFTGTQHDRRLTVGTAVDLTLPAATGGAGTVTYAVSPALPDGLDFDATTRVLSGTPTTAQTATTYM